MKVRQQSFIGGMVGRNGQYVHDVKSSFIEGVNLIPRRNGTLDTRPSDIPLRFNLLPTDKYLNFRYRGQVYHVIYDTFFKQKLKEIKPPFPGPVGESNLTGGFYHKYMTVNPKSLLDNLDGYTVNVSTDLSTTPHSIDVSESSVAKEIVRKGRESVAAGEDLYQFLVRVFPDTFREGRNFPLGCTYFEDIIKRGLGLRGPNEGELNVASNTFSARVAAHRDYFGFGLDRVLYSRTGMVTNPNPPPNQLTSTIEADGGWCYNFIRNHSYDPDSGDLSVPPRARFTQGNYNQSGISAAERVSGFNNDGNGFKVFENDQENTHNWYCRFLVFDEEFRLISYEVERPHFVEHDSGEPTAEPLTALDDPDNLPVPTNPSLGELETFLRGLMDRNLETSRLRQGVTGSVYEPTVFDEYVIFSDKEGKLPPMVFTPPIVEDTEHPYGYVRDLRCLYGLSGYVQESHIKGNETGGTSLVNRDGLTVERRNRNLGTVISMAKVFNLFRSDISTTEGYGPNPTTEQQAEIDAVNASIVEAIKTGVRQETSPSETINRIANTDTSLFNSPAVSFDQVRKSELPTGNPLETFNPREDASDDDRRELVTIVSKQVTVDKADAKGVTDSTTFESYLNSLRFSHLGAIVQVRNPGTELGPDSYQMVDLTRRDGTSFKQFMVEQCLIHEYIRLSNTRGSNSARRRVTSPFNTPVPYLNRGQSDKDFSVIPNGLSRSKIASQVSFLRQGEETDTEVEKILNISGGQSSKDFLVDGTFFKFDVGGLEESIVRQTRQSIGGGRFLPAGLNSIGQPHPIAFSTLVDKKLAVIDYAIGSNEEMYFNIVSRANSRVALADSFIRRDTVVYSQINGRLLFDNLIVGLPSGQTRLTLGFLQRFSPFGGAEIVWMATISNLFTIGLKENIIRYESVPVPGVIPPLLDESSSAVAPPIKSQDAVYQIGNSLRHVYLIEQSLELRRREYVSVTNALYSDYLVDFSIKKLVSIPNDGFLILLTEVKEEIIESPVGDEEEEQEQEPVVKREGYCFIGTVTQNGSVGWSRLQFNIENSLGVVEDVFVREGITYFVFIVNNALHVRSVDFNKGETLPDLVSELELISPYRFYMEDEEADVHKGPESVSVRGGKLIGSFANPVGVGNSQRGISSYSGSLREGAVNSIIDIGAVSLTKGPHLSGMRFKFLGKTSISALFFEVK